MLDKMLDDLSHALLAGIGGLIGAGMRKEATSWRSAVLATGSAAFIGFIVAKLCRFSGVSDDLTFVFCGMSGYIGATRTGLFIEQILVNKLGLKALPAQDKPKDDAK